MDARFSIRRFFALLAAMAILSPEVFAQSRVAPPAPDKGGRLTEEKSGSFVVRDGQRLRLFTDVGSIRVRTQNSGQVSYRVRIESEARQPDAQLYLSKFVLSARAVPDGVSINARVPWHEFRGRLWVTFELNIPRNFQLDLTTQAGNIETESIDGRISLVTAGGNLTVARVGGAARLETQGGHITVQDVAADLSAISAGGHLTVGTVEGDAVVRTGGGHIRVASVKGTAQLETGGGNISLERAGASIIVHTGGGRIDLGETPGAIRAFTRGGNIGVLNVVGPTQLETGSGSICLTKVQGAIHASTTAGTITAWFIPEGKLRGPSQLESGDGDILVYIPRELAVTIDATVEFPSENHIDADPAIPLKVTYSDAGPSGRLVRAEGALNGGGEVLRLKTVTGNIRLRYSDSPRMSIEPNYDALRRQLELRLKMRPEEFARQSQRQKQIVEKQQEVEQQARAEAKGAARERSRIQEWQRIIWSLWSGRRRVDSAEQKQRLSWSVDPVYPLFAKQQHIEGLVRLDVYVSSEGAVEDIKLLSGHPLLAQAAMDAVKQWRYTPFTVDSRPVPVVSAQDVDFRLK